VGILLEEDEPEANCCEACRREEALPCREPARRLAKKEKPAMIATPVHFATVNPVSSAMTPATPSMSTKIGGTTETRPPAVLGHL
jgi:hypothetical protein